MENNLTRFHVQSFVKYGIDFYVYVLFFHLYEM